MKNTNTTNLDKVTEIFSQVRDLETMNEQKKHKIQDQAKQIVDFARREADENYEQNILSTKDEIKKYLLDIEHKILSQENEQNTKIEREIETFSEHVDMKKSEVLKYIKSKLF